MYCSINSKLLLAGQLINSVSKSNISNIFRRQQWFDFSYILYVCIHMHNFRGEIKQLIKFESQSEILKTLWVIIKTFEAAGAFEQDGWWAVRVREEERDI